MFGSEGTCYMYVMPISHWQVFCIEFRHLRTSSRPYNWLRDPGIVMVKPAPWTWITGLPHSERAETILDLQSRRAIWQSDPNVYLKISFIGLGAVICVVSTNVPMHYTCATHLASTLRTMSQQSDCVYPQIRVR